MKTSVLSALALLAYSALLVKILVFKDLPTIRVGHLMLNFSGTDAGSGPNLIPFSTILPYVLGEKGLIIGGINLAGNIILFVPVGLLLPFLYQTSTWKGSVALGMLAGLSIEVLQTILRVGIFDIDDVILNALGVVVGYGMMRTLISWIR